LKDNVTDYNHTRPGLSQTPTTLPKLHSPATLT
jgi:hypothetical protein